MQCIVRRTGAILQEQIVAIAKWWHELTPFWRYFPGTAVLTWWLALMSGHHLSEDHLRIGTVILLLAYLGRVPRIILRFLLPLFLTAIVYDGKRYFADGIRGAIHVREPHDFDLKFFGMMQDGQLLTPPAWWQHHTYPVLDFISGIYYLGFIPIFVLFSAYFVFWVSRRGTKHVPAPELKVRSKGMMWSFFWVNVVGYSTYFWYPAAPPWYAERYGLGPADLTARPFAAGALRFDHLFNVHVFETMYSKGADVFGAVPSLHCAYPMLALVYALRFRHARWFAAVYWVGMVFSAIYLNHHYMLDALWGSAYAVMGVLIVDTIMKQKAQRARVVQPSS